MKLGQVITENFVQHGPFPSRRTLFLTLILPGNSLFYSLWSPKRKWVSKPLDSEMCIFLLL